MPSPLNGPATLAARVFIALIFLMSAVGNKIPKFGEVVNYMTAEGVPMPQSALIGAIAFLIVGSISIVVGYKARVGAALLLIFLILATYYFHDFWTFEGSDRQQQMIQFMKNLSMMGAMLFLMANGPGSLSLDERFSTTADITQRRNA